MINNIIIEISLDAYIRRKYPNNSSDLSITTIECIPKPYNELLEIFNESIGGRLDTPNGTTNYMQRIFKEGGTVYIDSLLGVNTVCDEHDTCHGWPVKAFNIKHQCNPKIALHLKD